MTPPATFALLGAIRTACPNLLSLSATISREGPVAEAVVAAFFNALEDWGDRMPKLENLKVSPEWVLSYLLS